MTAALLNILIGLVTSIVSGVSVWLWQRGRRSQLLRRKAAFFGLDRNSECLIVMNDKYSKPGSVAQHDVHALIEVAMLAREIGSPVKVTEGVDFQGHNNNSTEFCIGGPVAGSNPRTGGHLATHLPGVKVGAFSDREDSLAIFVGEDGFLCERHNREYVLIAKFTPPESNRPIIVICGQTSIGNRAGIAFLKREYRTLAKTLPTTSRFCIIVRVESIPTYGHQATRLAADVTAAAFSPREQPAEAN